MRASGGRYKITSPRDDEALELLLDPFLLLAENCIVCGYSLFASPAFSGYFNIPLLEKLLPPLVDVLLLLPVDIFSPNRMIHRYLYGIQR